jgi:hypothetical protein
MLCVALAAAVIGAKHGKLVDHHVAVGDLLGISLTLRLAGHGGCRCERSRLSPAYRARKSSGSHLAPGEAVDEGD